MIKVSVIIIGYNIEKYISRCLNSVISQTLKDIEIIFVDDGSNDNTLNIVNEYSKKDNRIKVFTQKNCGPYKARITGLNHANGEYIVFVDGDDWIDNKELEVLYKLIKEQNMNLIFFDFIKENYITNEKIKCQLDLPTNRIISKKEISEYVYKKCMGNTNFSSPCNKIIKKDFIISLNIPTDVNIKYGEDLLFLLKLYDNLEKTYYLPKEFYHYCVNTDNSLSQIHYNDAFFTIHKKLYLIREQYAKKWNVEQYLYANMAFLGICELIYDIKQTHRISAIKRYIEDSIFKLSVKEVDIKKYNKVISNKKTLILLIFLKILIKNKKERN